MMICPLEFRYGRDIAKSIFTEENRLRKMLKVEEALAYAYYRTGRIKEDDFLNIKKACENVKLERVKEIEKETKHDVMAIVKAITEIAGESGRYVHLGATSNDIVDTAVALQLKDFYAILEEDLKSLMKTLRKLSIRYRNTIMLGRTHGQHALPITFGLKCAVFLAEITRHYERILESRHRILVGKMMGAVGTGAGFGGKALEIESIVMDYLGLGVEEGPTQIIGRDRYIEFIYLISNISTTLERMATEIRNLQRPEIGEVQEYFDVEKQVGSSTMAHKINPITSENICSLSRIIRSFIIPSFENNILWHERDLTNSAGERFTIPHASILIDDIINKTIWVFENLKVNEERMRENLENVKYYIMDENIILKLVEKGMGRQDAHEIVRRYAITAQTNKMNFKDLFLSDNTVKKFINEKELEETVKPENYLGNSGDIIDRIIEKVNNWIGKEENYK
ncbi:MAG: adenylosuccinate lyase [Thermoplasmatales archaeon]|nr:adenylosuccinate lyase [Thermoplasmatales archaeon]